MGLQEITHLLQSTPMTGEKINILLCLLNDAKFPHLKPSVQKEHTKYPFYLPP